MRNELALFFWENPLLLSGADWLIKSVVVLVLALSISHAIKAAGLSSSARHLLWMCSIICLALTPIVYFALDAVSTAPAVAGNMITLTALANYPAEPILITTSNYSLAEILLYAYLLPGGLLLLRIPIGVFAVLRISNRASAINDIKINEVARKLTDSLNLVRSVEIKQSREITSPFSCGILFPTVILPEQAENWSQSTLEDVLMHEFNHIKRLDWLTMLVCHIVTCVYWINPLCWIALSRVNEEAESSCDSAALAYGRKANSYAESLVYVARQSRDEHRLLVQMMADKRLLPKRIKQILEEPLMPASATNKFRFQLVAMLAILIGLFSNLSLISAQSAGVAQVSQIPELILRADRSTIFTPGDSNYWPITAVAPHYPKRAQQRGITGWNLLSFSVNEDGNVDADTIVVVGSEPRGIFESSSIRAAAQLKFRPPRAGGAKVDVNGVQYLFKYELDERVFAGLYTKIKNREYLPLNYITPYYPPAASEESVEGHVLVEFTVTKQGIPAGIVILDRSPSNIFNASAINAAERFRFVPKIVDGEPAEAEGAQYLFSFKPGG